MILSILKLATEKQDWDLVKLVIKDLESQPLKTYSDYPQPIRAQYPPPDINAVAIAREEAHKGEGTNIDKILEDLDKPKQENFAFVTSTKKPESKESTRQWFNKFVDDGSEGRNHEDKKLYSNKPRKPRDPDRGTHFVEVKCCQCSKTEEVAPILARQYKEDPEENLYYCNKCLQEKIKSHKSE